MKEAAISQGERNQGKLLFVSGRNEGEGESSGGQGKRRFRTRFDGMKATVGLFLTFFASPSELSGLMHGPG